MRSSTVDQPITVRHAKLTCTLERMTNDLQRVLDGSDPSVRIQDDLFRAINGIWFDTTEIPSDLPYTGAFIDLVLESEEHVKEIIEDISAANPTEGEAQKIAAMYNSWMATDRLSNAAAAADLAAISAASTHTELARVAGELATTGVDILVDWFVESAFDNPDRNCLFLGQSGLGLPDEAYYREPEHAEVLAKYEAFVPRLLALALNTDDAEASRIASDALAIEKRFAAVHMNVVDSRDTDKTNHPMSFDAFAQSAPGFDWAGAFAAAGASNEALADDINVMQPDALRSCAKIWGEADLDVLKNYLRWSVVRARASYMSEEVDEASFDFYGRVIHGTTEQRDRWKRGVRLIEDSLGEAVGKEYVKRHFPATHKAKMVQLVEDLLEAYRRSIRDLDWMSEETKKRALAKVDSFTVKIGYPDVWRDYSALELGDDLAENVRRSNRFENARDFAKLGKAVDRREWGMPPQMVNAYYNPLWNEIVFPAAILQFPFFDPERDAALNYGGIGAVIGHEIGHGFDDQGAKFGPDGSLTNWWTDADLAAFQERTSALVAQYDAYIPAEFGEDGPHVKGALTLGENIGDLGGLSIALKAYEISLEREGLTLETAPEIDGYTATQRVFLSWARVWREKSRKESLEQQVATDPHSPVEFRANGVVKNVDAFAEAFGVVPGDALWLDPAKRVRIW